MYSLRSRAYTRWTRQLRKNDAVSGEDPAALQSQRGAQRRLAAAGRSAEHNRLTVLDQRGGVQGEVSPLGQKQRHDRRFESVLPILGGSARMNSDLISMEQV